MTINPYSRILQNLLQDFLLKIMIKLTTKAILMMMYRLLSLKNLSKKEESHLQKTKMTIIKNSNKRYSKNKNKQKPMKNSKTMTFWATKN